LVVAAGSLACALVHDLRLLVAVRFVQGLFLPALTTCLAAYLARSLPLDRLNVVMGSYVSATVAGGLLGRLLGGWIHPPLHWRYAFVSASLLVMAAGAAAFWRLPRETDRRGPLGRAEGFLALLKRPECLSMFLVALGAFFVFSSIFNYLPFHLSGPPFNASTNLITMMYLTYLIGVVTGPLAGRISNRLGAGAALVLGSLVFALAVALTLIPSLPAVALGLAGVCLGFFTVHAAAAGALNRRLKAGQGRANSLYVLFYYLGGYLGITLAGAAWDWGGWKAVASQDLVMLALPLGVGLWEMRRRKA
jgi:YNFM family putative membrane transporter